MVVPHKICSFCASTLASASVPPPGGNPTTMRIGPLGKLWALIMGAAKVATLAALAWSSVLRCMVMSPVVGFKVSSPEGARSWACCATGQERMSAGMGWAEK